MVKRYYTRVIKRAPKKRWASHIEQFVINGTNVQGATIYGGSFAVNKTLAVTNVDTAVPTPTIIKTGRFSLQYSFLLDLHNSNNKAPYDFLVTLYILYIPQGWPIDPGATATNFVNKFDQITNLIGSHPEWIIAKRQLGDWNQIPASADGWYDSKTNVLSSKLKRNLNSGDQIMLVATVQKAINDATNYPVGCKFQGSVTYYTTPL